MDWLVFGPILVLALLFLWWMEKETEQRERLEYQQRSESPPWQLESRQAMEESLRRLVDSGRQDVPSQDLNTQNKDEQYPGQNE